MQLFRVIGSVFCVAVCAVSLSALANQTLPTLPISGLKMQQVVAQFGQPAEKLPSLGRPPITVWRYADFNVYFEHQTVLHSVRFVPFVRPIDIVVVE